MRYTNPIRNCVVEFRKLCPLKWESLGKTPDPGVRLCTTCSRDVYFCDSDEEAIHHAKAGHCIAKPQPDGSDLLPIYLGEPEPPPPTPAQIALGEEIHHERAKTNALRNLKYTERFCPGCGYPCPEWKPVCRVCGFEIGRVSTTQ